MCWLWLYLVILLTVEGKRFYKILDIFFGLNDTLFAPFIMFLFSTPNIEPF